jgi:hypothetical protein
MVKLNLTIETGNAAVVENPFGEVAALLREVAGDVDDMRTERVIRDANGHRVGTWTLQVEED